VARLMRELGWAARPKRAFRPRTTQAGPEAGAPNRIKDLVPSRPDQIWVSDITYVATREGWLYLAVILDFFSRLVVGWKVGESLEAGLVVTALQNALSRREPPRGLIFHSDQGCQYSSQAVRQPLTLLGIQPSMSARGNCYENATAEAFFSTLKTEAFPSDQVFTTKGEARRELFEYIEVYYNNQRLHSSLGYQTPRQYETNFKEVIDSRNGVSEVLVAAPEDRALRGRTSSAGAGLQTAGQAAERRPAGPCRSKPKAKNPREFEGQRPSSPTPKTPKKTENRVSVVLGEVQSPHAAQGPQAVLEAGGWGPGQQRLFQLVELVGAQVLVGAGFAAAAQAGRALALPAAFPAVGRGVSHPHFGRDFINPFTGPKQCDGIHALLLQTLPQTQLSLDDHPEAYHI
jgi:transposase InsO family protein